jgi:selenocysteine-specific elongation factor
MTVLGTAGHVDHGKTTLVHALTGIDTDRLPEEKRRGITIELGFAPLVIEDDGGRRTIAIVDVPGHERFVGTMAAGAQGVDAALLVVAADAGVMPQTREHLLVLDALGVRALVVALSRCDLADAETRALARVDVEEALAKTRWARGTPIVEVSAKTGEGLDALRAAIARITRDERAFGLGARRRLPARLAIDRVFAPRGQGVVATGTLIAGAIAVGDELELLPDGRSVRVRGVHQHGEATPRALATGRVALALSGIELSELHRGAVLTTPGSLLPARAFDAILTRAPGGRPFGRRARLSIHAGTDEVRARAIPLARLEPPMAEGEALPTTIRPGERWLVRAVLARPTPVAAADRLVVRADGPLASVGTTLGALTVLRLEPGRLSGGRRAYAARVLALEHETALARARFEIESAGLAGRTLAELAPRLPSRQIDKELTRALGALELRGGGRWVGAEARAHAATLLEAALGRFHREHPDDEGAPLATALSAMPANAAPGLGELVLESLIAGRRAARVGDRVRLASFQPRARADDPAAQRLLAALAEGGIAPATLPELARTLGLAEDRARGLASALASADSVVHVQGDLWIARRALDALGARLLAHLDAHGQITTQEFKALVGASRKYVVPLAEWFDAQRITLRVGEVRKRRGG